MIYCLIIPAVLQKQKRQTQNEFAFCNRSNFHHNYSGSHSFLTVRFPTSFLHVALLLFLIFWVFSKLFKILSCRNILFFLLAVGVTQRLPRLYCGRHSAGCSRCAKCSGEPLCMVLAFVRSSFPQIRSVAFSCFCRPIFLLPGGHLVVRYLYRNSSP